LADLVAEPSIRSWRVDGGVSGLRVGIWYGARWKGTIDAHGGGLMERVVNILCDSSEFSFWLVGTGIIRLCVRLHSFC